MGAIIAFSCELEISLVIIISRLLTGPRLAWLVMGFTTSLWSFSANDVNKPVRFLLDRPPSCWWNPHGPWLTVISSNFGRLWQPGNSCWFENTNRLINSIGSRRMSGVTVTLRWCWMIDVVFFTCTFRQKVRKNVISCSSTEERHIWLNRISVRD